MEVRFSKIKSTGGKIALGPPKIFPAGASLVQEFLDSSLKNRRVHFVINENQTLCPRILEGILQIHLPTSDGNCQFLRSSPIKYGHFGQVRKPETRRRNLRIIKGRAREQRTNIGKPLANVTYESCIEVIYRW